MYCSRNSHLYFTEPPDWDELCQVTVTVPATNPDPSRPRSLQPQVIKCRELIFTEPDIIATPSMNQENKVTIIMQKSLHTSGKLQNRLQKMNILADSPRPVIPPEFQSCLNYTLMAKMAPAWNKVGEYLVQGREFLTNMYKMNAVEYQLTVNESEMFASLRAHVFRLPPIQLSDIDVYKPALNEFLQTRTRIEVNSIQKQWCHILPTMKKGQIVTVSHQLPPDCPYRSYRELKRFWKNMYGYRLPEDDTGVLFYQVYFRPLGNTLFTYPECCLRPRPPAFLPRPDDGSIVRTFLSDLHSRVPSVCGRKLCFSNQPSYPSSELLDVDEVEDMMKENLHPNVTDERPVTWRPGVYTASPPPTRPVFSCNSNVAPKMTPQPPVAFSASLNSRQQNGLSNDLQIAATASDAAIRPTFQMSAVTSNVQPIPNASNSGSSSEKIVPKFKPSFKPQLMRTPQPSKSSGGPRHVPSFRPVGSRGSTHTVGSGKLPALPSLQGATSPAASKPMQVRPDFHTAENPDLFNFNSTAPAMKPSFVKKLAPSIAPRFTPNLPKPNSATAPQFSGKKPQVVSRKPPSTPKQSKVKTPFKHTPLTPTLTPHNFSDSGLGSSLLESPSPSSQNAAGWISDSQDVIAPTPCTPSMKRPLDPNGTPVSKKPRAKPKIQENVDVEALARSNMLGKVNSITLATWLKDRGVVCKSKDKKGDLVEKAVRLLNLQPTEQ